MDEPCTSIQADDELRELHDDIERMKQIIETGEDSQSRSFVGAAESTRQFGESTNNEESNADHEDCYASYNDLTDLNDLPVTPQNCLALNRTYQEIVVEMLKKIELLLLQNRERQALIKDEFEDAAEEKVLKLAKKKPFTIYAAPYFRDIHGMFPPVNDDVRSKRALGIMNPFSKPTKKLWKAAERNKLREAVHDDKVQKTVSLITNRRELEMEKLKKATLQVEFDTLEAKIAEIDNEIAEIRKAPAEQMYGSRNDPNIDWMKISATNFDGKRSAKDIEQFWRNAGHPCLKTTRWTAEEDAKLKVVAERHQYHDWETIAYELNTGRSAFMCLQRYQTRLNPQLVTGKWLPEEDTLLIEVVENLATGESVPWLEVASCMEGRSSEQCASRWEILHPKQNRRGKWTLDEDLMLMDAVQRCGKNWNAVAKHVPNRNALQCRERWFNACDNQLRICSWKVEEDRKLFQLVDKYGEGRWSLIATELPGRTDNMIMQRYWSLCRWKDKCGIFKLLSNSLIKRLCSPETYKHLMEIAQTSNKMTDAKAMLEEEQLRLTRRVSLHTVNMKGKARKVADDARKRRLELSKILGELRELIQKEELESNADFREDSQTLCEAKRLTSNVNTLSEMALENTIASASSSIHYTERTKVQRAMLERVERALLASSKGIDLTKLTREELRKRILQLNLPLGSIPDTPMLKRFITKIRAKKNCAGHPKKAKEEVDVDIEIMKLLRDRMLKRTKRGRPRKYTVTPEEKETACPVPFKKRKIGVDCRPNCDEEIVKNVGKMLISAFNVDTEACLTYRMVLQDGDVPSNHLQEEDEMSDNLPNEQTNSNQNSLNKSRAKNKDDIEAMIKETRNDLLLLEGILGKKGNYSGSSTLTVQMENSAKSVHSGRNNSWSKQQNFRLPPLPPSCASLNAFKILLLNAAQLEWKARQFGVTSFRENKTSEATSIASNVVSVVHNILENVLVRPPQNEAHSNACVSISKNQPSKTLMENVITKIKSAVEYGTLPSSCSSGSFTIASPDEVLKMEKIRTTRDYRLLQARMMSLFLWPALMSSLAMQDCNMLPLNEEEPLCKKRQKYHQNSSGNFFAAENCMDASGRKKTNGTNAVVEDNQDNLDEEEIRQGFNVCEQDSLVENDFKARRKLYRYAMTFGKKRAHYLNLTLEEKKYYQHIWRKRLETRQRNKLLGKPSKSKKPVAIEPKRRSARMQQKFDYLAAVNNSANCDDETPLHANTTWDNNTHVNENGDLVDEVIYHRKMKGEPRLKQRKCSSRRPVVSKLLQSVREQKSRNHSQTATNTLPMSASLVSNFDTGDNFIWREDANSCIENGGIDSVNHSVNSVQLECNNQNNLQTAGISEKEASCALDLKNQLRPLPIAVFNELGEYTLMPGVRMIPIPMNSNKESEFLSSQVQLPPDVASFSSSMRTNLSLIKSLVPIEFSSIMNQSSGQEITDERPGSILNANLSSIMMSTAAMLPTNFVNSVVTDNAIFFQNSQHYLSDVFSGMSEQPFNAPQQSIVNSLTNLQCTPYLTEQTLKYSDSDTEIAD